jgi:hypothetical protein
MPETTVTTPSYTTPWDTILWHMFHDLERYQRVEAPGCEWKSGTVREYVNETMAMKRKDLLHANV